MRVFSAAAWRKAPLQHGWAIPTIEEEDRRPTDRERQNLVTEQTRIINQIKAILPASAFALCARPCASLPKGSKILRTAEGTPLPQNTLSELRRHLARLRFVRDQIHAVEQERLRKLAVAPAAETKSPDAMVRLIARVLALVSKRRTCWSTRSSRALARSQGRRPLRRSYRLARRSGSRRRERGLARAGNVRVRCGMIQLGLAFCQVPKNSALAQWFAARTATDAPAHADDDVALAVSCSSPSGSRYEGRGSAGHRATAGRHEQQHGKRATTGQTAWQPVLGVCR